MNIRYRVELSEAELSLLAAMLSSGKHTVRKLKRAQTLPAATPGSATRRSRAVSQLAGRRFTGPNDAS
jgi:hypothetical protein